MCFETECIMTLQGHPRSLILAPIESAYMTSYWTSMVTLVLSCRANEILVRQKPLFRYPSPIRAKISGCSPWSRSVVLGSVKSKHPRLTNREIIFEVFQPMWSRHLNVTDRETTCRSNTALRVASCGKKYNDCTSMRPRPKILSSRLGWPRGLNIPARQW